MARHAGGQYDYIARLNAMDAEIQARQNLLHNGAFQVWQRGTSFTIGANRAYTADRWVAYRGGLVTGMSVSQQTGGNAKFCARVQRVGTDTSVAGLSFVQQVEDIDLLPYRGQFVTLRFRARCGGNFSASGSILTAYLNTGTGVNEQNDYAYAGIVATSVNHVLTTSFQTFDSVTLQVPANANEMALNFSFTPTGTAGAADYFEVEEVQVVPTQYPGNFPYRTAGIELLTCQRFFQLAHGSGSAATTAIVDAVIALSVPMRATPTILAPAVITVYDGSVGIQTQSAASAVWQAAQGARGGIARYANLASLTAARAYQQYQTTPVQLSADL